jgi:hypothetical protein
MWRSKCKSHKGGRPESNAREERNIGNRPRQPRGSGKNAGANWSHLHRFGSRPHADNFNRRIKARLRSVKVISYAKKNQE